MARVFLRSFEAHSYSYVTKMIDKKKPSGRVRSSGRSAAQTPYSYEINLFIKRQFANTLTGCCEYGITQ